MAATRRRPLGRMLMDTDGVQVWAHLPGDGGPSAGDVAILDADELARARRLRFGRDRWRFVQRHAFTRRVLARYLSADPAAIGFHTSGQGKPELDPVRDISFNVSGADDLTVVAVTRGREVGVDVERLRPIEDAADVASDLFTRPEADLVHSVPTTSRSATFLSLWTRKESFVKAVGRGLSMPLDAFDVSTQDECGNGQPHGPQGALPFDISPLEVPPGFVGAIALGPARRVTSDGGSEVVDR